MGSRRIRLQEARRQIEIVKRLKRRRAMVALTAAASMASLPVERRKYSIITIPYHTGPVVLSGLAWPSSVQYGSVG